jgi:hypothetical protein
MIAVGSDAPEMAEQEVSQAFHFRQSLPPEGSRWNR